MSTPNPQASVTATILQVANPLGSVTAYSGSQDPPTGGVSGEAQWILCDGRALDQETYSALYNLIGTSFGNGTVNNPNQIQNAFNIPDLRGRFIRGTDDMNGTAAGNDPDLSSRTAMMPGGNTGQNANKIGSLQPDGVVQHSHNYTAQWQQADDGGGFTGYGFDSNSTPSNPRTYTSSYIGGNETRPKNAYLNFIIRVK
ncbi:MAG: hypothetical protein DMF64_17435 [Acidobacteria bacterium]|nr:MAG: hypothetical protein DMF64_17435 [Acidobacteriota bacterium]